MKLLFASLFLLSSTLFECSARECPPLKTSDNEAFEYISTVVESLGYLKTATTTLHSGSAKAQKGNGVGTTTDLMVSMKQASEDYECAATLLNGFAKSKDETISLSAQVTSLMYQKLQALNGEMLDILKQALDGKISQSDLSDRISTNSVERDETFRQLMKAVSGATFPLVVVPKKESETILKLNITPAQKRELLTTLERSFGLGIKKGFVAGLPLADAPAHLIYE